ncbi:MAG: transporter substrate-binding domain-containing protein [Intrasporangiaceae bacterium]|nr:transporter substrate-binding domain-containing protein [Intrasporangiaceae bacterium]
MRLTLALLCGLVILALGGCGTIPRDPDGTLERVRSEQSLRVGASDGADRLEVHVAGDGGAEVSGTEADLVSGFAEELGAQIEWTVGGETELVHAMERGELDVIIGGLHSDSPWADAVSLTRPYAESTDPEGSTVQHVLAVPLGENGFLVTLERYLDREAE